MYNNNIIVAFSKHSGMFVRAKVICAFVLFVIDFAVIVSGGGGTLYA